MNKTWPLLAAENSAFRQHLQYWGVDTTGRLPESGLYLCVRDDALALAHTDGKGVVQVDFAAGSARHRRLHGGGELLGRAVKHSSQPTVWDATGGLGRDAFVLASLGLQVRVFERHPVVCALLADGLRRALAGGGEEAAIAARIDLQQADAAVAMPAEAAQSGGPDVVYLDPMYPQRHKTAAVKKEMAYFHQLVGEAAAADDAALLDAACRSARKRVVVKRPPKGEFLCGRTPAYQYQGKAVRFDVYLPYQAA
ncbi:16S rRNA (guanine1516-N2)-methyltransferase [Neisseria sp. HSC-16F19]|nr:class I SAM-dependent methyltransferase [Neisseria sp. HSC-16F19]MCP2039440.1 16S rRNA (guanine1516-N2)-methyltransferase [Neisseria sp. HSC-16F19]